MCTSFSVYSCDSSGDGSGDDPFLASLVLHDNFKFKEHLDSSYSTPEAVRLLNQFLADVVEEFDYEVDGELVVEVIDRITASGAPYIYFEHDRWTYVGEDDECEECIELAAPAGKFC